MRMRFAFKTNPQDTTWADVLAVWRVADDIELFESGWTFDHFYPIFSDSNGPCMEGWITLTALAQATRRLRMGEKRTLRTVAHWAQHWNMIPPSVEAWQHKRAVLDKHCAAAGRDPREIMTSVQIRLDPNGDTGPLVDQADAYAEAGVDLFVVYLQPPLQPSVVEQVATALSR